jgi:hypothetical protein
MIDSVFRRLTTAARTAFTKPPSAAPPATTPTLASRFTDALETRRSSPVSLSGGNDRPIRLPSFLDRLWGGGATKVGPKMLHLQDGWTPQGQGYDAKRGEVLTTYYDETGVLLSIQDKRSGAESHQVMLGGLAPGKPAPTHGGGVSTEGDFVYVADTKNIFVYTRAELERAAKEGTPATASQVMPVPRPKELKDPVTGMELVSAGSYMTVKDGYAYVGAYSPDGDGKAGAVWRYEIDEKTGAIVEDSRQGPIRAPDRAQGVTVVDGALLFTTGDQKLIHQPITDDFQADIKDRTDIGNGLIDPYAQGLNIIDGELWVTYESGSDKYRDKVDHPREHIQRIPLEDLDLKAAGLTPEQLSG